MVYTVNLIQRIRHRYVALASLSNADKSHVMTDIRVLFDTGAFNTMIDATLAGKFGTLLPYSMAISIGGKAGKAQYCIIDSMTFGNFSMSRVFALAYPFEGWLMRNIILGTNVINNWDFTISRTNDILQFSEKFPPDVPFKKYPYLNYFKGGNYVATQDEINENDILIC